MVRGVRGVRGSSFGEGAEVNQSGSDEREGKVEVLLVEPDELGQDAVVRLQAKAADDR
jgi:hypothetical protein